MNVRKTLSTGKGRTPPAKLTRQQIIAAINTNLAPIKRANPEFYAQIRASLLRMDPSMAVGLNGLGDFGDALASVGSAFSGVLSDALKTYGNIKIGQAQTKAQLDAANAQLAQAQAQAIAAHKGTMSSLSGNTMVWGLGIAAAAALAWFAFGKKAR